MDNIRRTSHCIIESKVIQVIKTLKTLVSAGETGKWSKDLHGIKDSNSTRTTVHSCPTGDDRC
jgi:hypothetical protein